MVSAPESPWSAEEMTSAMDQLHALSMTTWRELLVFVAEYDRTEAYRADGMVSMADWLVARYGLARRTANDWVRAASAFEVLPAVADAVANGRLSADQTRSVIRLATPETDAVVAADAVGRSAAELEMMVRLAKPPTETDANEADRLRSFRWRDSPDGSSVRLSGQLPAEAGATLAAALSRMAEQAGPDPDTKLWDPFESRCADALVELAGARLADDEDPDRATIVVHVPAEWFDETDEADVDRSIAAALDSGVPLATETLRRLACDARVQLVTEGPGHAAMARSAMEHTVPFWLRRQLRRRDGGCRWHGCRRTQGVHAHHIVWFSKGGPSSKTSCCCVADTTGPCTRAVGASPVILQASCSSSVPTDAPSTPDHRPCGRRCATGFGVWSRPSGRCPSSPSIRDERAPAALPRRPPTPPVSPVIH